MLLLCCCCCCCFCPCCTGVVASRQLPVIPPSSGQRFGRHLRIMTHNAEWSPQYKVPRSPGFVDSGSLVPGFEFRGPRSSWLSFAHTHICLEREGGRSENGQLTGKAHAAVLWFPNLSSSHLILDWPSTLWPPSHPLQHPIFHILCCCYFSWRAFSLTIPRPFYPALCLCVCACVGVFLLAKGIKV